MRAGRVEWSLCRRVFLCAAAILMTACSLAANIPANKTAEASRCPAPEPQGDVKLTGGMFVLGAHPENAEEGPAREVTVKPFSIDRTEVTNAQFTEFVKATGYATLAERAPDPKLYPGVPADQLKPAAIVFVGASGIGAGDPTGWWRLVEGASWKNPEGPGSDLKGRENHPVVEIAHEDALAYARWRGRDLPTEAEWEFAARAGLPDSRYEWGDAGPNTPTPRANTWQGVFPAIDAGDDGYKARTAPVGCYAPNAYGLYDMTGNVWEWTKDWYPDGRDDQDPQRQHLIKGGSFLCADNFCARYRPSARQGGPPDTGSSHIGFRTVLRQ
ncbi:MAG: formylglycine-generating enzyme family protein [Caulobacterales bacterium]